jgi:hypothetical protein
MSDSRGAATDLDGFPAPLIVSVPITQTSAGVPGQTAFDSSYSYLCTAPNTWKRILLSTWQTVILTYVSDGDTNGVFTYLGGGASWTNPQTSGVIALSASNLGSGTLDAIVDHAASDTFDNPQANNWFAVDLGATRTLILNEYSYRQRNAGGNLMTQMKIQGSKDNSIWTDLTSADSPTTGNSVWTSFPVVSSIAYRYFRIMRTAADSGSNTYFTIGEWELYGTLTTP